MKFKILCMAFVFGTLAAQNPINVSDGKPANTEKAVGAVPKTVTVNADEFQRVKDLLFGLALQNYQMVNKEKAEPLDLAYSLLLENNKLRNDNAEIIGLANAMAAELKDAKNTVQVKAILKKYGF